MPSLLSVQPSAVEFTNVELNVRYIMALTIQNISTSALRYRITPPVSKCFRIVNAPTRLIAPGISLNIDVEFIAKTLEEHQIDRMIIEAADTRIEVPIRAFVPTSKIEFDGFVNLGPVVINNRAAAFIELVNNGFKEGKFDIEYDDSLSISITPTCGVISANPGCNSERVRIDFAANEFGVFRAIANVKLPGQADRVIDINATVVEHRLEFVLPEGGGQVTNIPFGSIYYGQERIVEVLLVNNGPKPVAYQANLVLPNEDELPETSETGLPRKPDLTMTPHEGVITPYSNTPFVFQYKPIKPAIPKGFSSSKISFKPVELVASLTIESSEIDQVINIDLSGTVAYPQVELSEREFNFGSCPSNERKDKVFTIKNSGILPIQYAINKVAHFSCRPRKGRLEPLQTQTAIMSFTPRQLGTFQNVLHLVVGDNLQTISIKLKGQSQKIGTKNKIIEGITKVPKDFKPKFNFVRESIPNNQCELLTPKFHREPPWKQALDKGIAIIDPEEFSTSNETRLTYSITELEQRDLHRQKYNDFLKESRTRREEAANNREMIKLRKGKGIFPRDPMHPINLGMETTNDRDAPFPDLPKASDKLWLKNEAGGSSAGARIVLDENKLIKKKFKPSPVTQAERKDCSTPLTPEELKRITIGPKNINYGRTCVNSTSKKSFVIMNDLKQTILVALEISDDLIELQGTTPRSQVIPPGATAGFDIAFYSRSEQDFTKSFNYVINGHHRFKLSLFAEVVPISLDLSKDLIEFSFAENNLEKTITESILLRNPGNADAQFTCSFDVKCAFAISPESGTIPPGGSCSLEVTFVPAQGVLKQALFHVNVSGGNSYSVHCFGNSPDPKCIVRDKKLDFGTIAAGVEKQLKCTLANTGTCPAVYYIDPFPPEFGIVISPTIGRLTTSDHQEIVLAMNAVKPIVMENLFLSIHLRGGKDLRIPVLANAVIPSVRVTQESLDFGGLTIGVHAMQLVTIANEGPIPGILYLDLSNYTDFLVVLTEDANTNEDGQTIFQGISHEEGDRNQATNAELEDSKELQHQDLSHDYCRKWKITIPHSTSVSFELHFAPQNVVKYAFPLPLSLAGIEYCAPLQPLVTAEGLRPRLLLSNSLIDFGERVVQRDSLRKVPYTLELRVTNDDTSTLTWSLDSTPLKQYAVRSIFHLAPTHGELAPGDTSVIRINFLPADPKEYELEIPVHLDDNADKKYVSVTLKGIGILPHLSFSHPEIILPLVPLSIKSIAKFKVFNTGYDNLELKYRLPVDTARVPISLHFPHGKNIGIANPEASVEVHFQSKKPLSFCAKLEFFDNEGNLFTLPITGTADNCLLSNYEFIEAHGEEFDFYQPSASSVIFTSKQHIKVLQGESSGGDDIDQNGEKSVERIHATKKSSEARPGSHFVDPKGCVLDEIFVPSTTTSKPSVEFLLNWLGVNLLKSPTKAIPEDFVESNGKPVYEMVENACAKPIPGRVSPLSASKKERADQLIGQYTDMIRFLKSYGAMLHSIRPEHLLSKELYVLAKEVNENSTDQLRRTSTAMLAHRRYGFEKEWRTLCSRGWVNIIYQVIKIFVLFRVTPKSFESLPGINGKFNENPQDSSSTKDDSKRSSKNPKKPVASKRTPNNRYALDVTEVEKLSGSNVFSLSENLLLKWLSIHFNRFTMTSKFRDIVNFSSDLEDGVVLCSVILSHIPTLASPGRRMAGFHPQVTNSKQAQDNIAAVFEGLHEVGIGLGVNEDHFPLFNARDMLLFVLHLFQSLPQFIPKTIIEFSGTLGTVIQKSIDLKNPSKKEITYHVILEGSNEFSIQSNSLVLEPQSCASFLVELRPRFTRSVEARLTFRSVSNGGSFSATMVFVLKSIIHSRKAIRTIQVESMTYESQMVTLDILNQYPVDGSYKIQLIQDSQALTSKPDTASSQSRGQSKTHAMVPATMNEFVNQQQPFYLKTESINLRANAAASISVQFLPLKPGNYKCHVLLLDESVGEFVYEILGHSLLPIAHEKLSFTTELKPTVSKDLIVPFKNPMLQKAINTCIERMNGSIKTKTRDALKRSEENEPLRFIAEVNSPYWHVPAHSIAIKEGKCDKPMLQSSRGGNSDQENSIPINLQPKGPGLYPCKVVLRSDYDIRIYDIEATVTSPGVKTSLEFSAPARQTIIQDIPITNSTTVAWALRVNISGSKYFTGPTGLTVQPGQSSNYPLTFKPAWICDESAQLVLSNTSTNEKFEYELRGIGEEPLPEGQVAISCKARESVEQLFDVINLFPKDLTIYTVESDLPHVSGPSRVEVGANGKSSYALQFSPVVGGTYSGSITFTSSSGPYFWYLIEAEVARPDPESTIEIEATVRGAVAVEISLANPLEEEVSFDIELNGSGLLGDSVFELNPLETATYELVYSPLLSGLQNGAIVFSNSKIGEFWYRLTLKALAAPPVELRPMRCAVGAICSQPISLTNPIGESLELSYIIDNKRNYSIRDSRILLEPYETVNVLLDYSPSSLTLKEPANIKFVHAQLGHWEFSVEGTGEKPDRMKEILVNAIIGQNTSSLFTFRNPFPSELGVEILLEDAQPCSGASATSVFKLMVKKHKVTLPGFGSLQVPISFTPTQITEYRKNIVIQGDAELKWTYPLRGVAEAPPQSKAYVLSCRARESCEQVLAFDISDGFDSSTSESFHHELVASPENRRFIDHSISITPITTVVDNPSTPLEYSFRFDPLRPFSCSLDLLIHKASGGQWRFQINLEAEEPPIDDLIIIESTLHQTSSVSFRICNQFRESAKFRSEFTVGSSPSFTVFPTSGELEPYGSEGTKFIVSFTPVEYGKPLTGRLIILTDEMQWTFDVKGTHPEYKVPIRPSVIDNTLSKHVAERLGRKKHEQKKLLKHNTSTRSTSSFKEH